MNSKQISRIKWLIDTNVKIMSPKETYIDSFKKDELDDVVIIDRDKKATRIQFLCGDTAVVQNNSFEEIPINQ